MAYDPTEIESYIRGASFPATGSNLADTAASNGAPQNIIDALRSFESQNFTDPPAVAKTLTQYSG